MHHNSTTSLQRAQHYSFKDLKGFLSSHEDFFDDILEKTMEAGILILVAALIYMVILAIYTLNHANHVYTSGLACFFCHTMQDLMYNALKIFM